jgi:predicted small secreted protein
MAKNLFLFILLAVAFLCGCQTVKYTAMGAVLPARGFGEDVYNVYQSVVKGDEWFQEKYW